MTKKAQHLSPNSKEYVTNILAVQTAYDPEIDHPERMMRALETWLERQGYSGCEINRDAFMGAYNACKSDIAGVSR